jgi:hypothetical protein
MAVDTGLPALLAPRSPAADINPRVCRRSKRTGHFI